MNLVSNAVESVESKVKGILTIETKYLPRKERIVAKFKDTGIGIPQENLTRIFEPFLQLKNREKVSGSDFPSHTELFRITAAPYTLIQKSGKGLLSK